MSPARYSLNHLHAFAVASRHLNMSRAADELCVTPTIDVALAPAAMFRRELAGGRLVQPFTIEIDVGRYWLARSLGRDPPPAFDVLREWLVSTLSTRVT